MQVVSKCKVPPDIAESKSHLAWVHRAMLRGLQDQGVSIDDVTFTKTREGDVYIVTAEAV